MQLTSARNPFLQDVRRAAAAGQPTDGGCVVIEGPHLVGEALRSRWRIDNVLVTPHGRERHSDLLSKTSAEIVEIPARTFESLAGVETSQEIMALVTPAVYTWADCLDPTGIAVILDGIQDPGNAGTTVRSAEGFGVAGLIFLEGCVRVANGKFLRATAGSIFPHAVFGRCEARRFHGTSTSGGNKILRSHGAGIKPFERRRPAPALRHRGRQRSTRRFDGIERPCRGAAYSHYPCRIPKRGHGLFHRLI